MGHRDGDQRANAQGGTGTGRTGHTDREIQVCMGRVVSTRPSNTAQVKDRLKCSYCQGSGQITCGRCYGAKLLEIRDPTAEDGLLREACRTCEGTGTVVCINCQGSGVQIPEDFLQKLGDSEVGFTEEDYIGL